MIASDEIKQVKDIIQAVLKAKKTIRMYPENNPIYTKTLDDTFQRVAEFFAYRDELTLHIRQHEILFDSEQVYHNPEKEDNIALFFFKDGLRELKFKRNLTKEELEGFLKIIILDFDREFIDDDIVTLLWERDFENIKYIVDDAFLSDDEQYEESAVSRIKENAPETGDIMKAYSEAFSAEDIGVVSIVNLTDKDLNVLVKEIDHDSEDKTWKMAEILFEMIAQAENKTEFEDIAVFLKDLMLYSIANKNLKVFIDIAAHASDIAKDHSVNPSVKNQMAHLVSLINKEEMVKEVGIMLNSETDIPDALIEEYIGFLDKNAVSPFISVLGDMNSIRGRRTVINILIQIGPKDLQALARGLHDSRWYVVRNIIYILRNIGDKKAVEHLLSTAKHPDIRVRKETIKTLGELKSPLALQALKEALNDADESVRKSSARALGNLGSETARRLIIEKISDNDFSNRDFEEKKDFYEVLARWNDADTVDFLMKQLKKKAFFKRNQALENKACASYSLGLMKCADALPLLHKLSESSNRLLKDFVNTAIKRIEHGE